MSGDPEILVCDAAGLSEEGPRKRLPCEADRFLLTYQWPRDAILKGYGEYKKRLRHGDEELRRIVRCSLRFLGRAMVTKTGHPERRSLSTCAEGSKTTSS